VESEGAGSLHPVTLITLFKESLLVNAHRPALALKRKDKNGVLPTEWKFWTQGEYWELCLSFGKSMLALGLQTHAIVNILGFNAPEWLIGTCSLLRVEVYVFTRPYHMVDVTRCGDCFVLAC